MALAVTHILIPIVLLDILRHYVFGLKKFPRYLVVMGGLFGLVPDIDIPLSWLYNALAFSPVDFHRLSFTHSLVFPLVFVLIGAFFSWKNNHKWASIFYVISIGWLTHIGLDWSYGEYKAIFWPFFTADISLFPQWKLYDYAAEIDAILLVLWIVHEEVHNRIKDYI